jgi:exosortase O
MISEEKLIRFQAKQGVGWATLCGSSLLVLSWLYLNLPSLQWLVQTLPKAAPFNLVLVALGGLLLIVQGVRYRETFRISAVPVLHPLPLILMVGCAIAAIAIPWFLDIEQLPALLFLLGSYGLMGLFLTSSSWRTGLPLAIAIAFLLPFSIQFTTGLGLPTRLLTAHAVEGILARSHIWAITSEDIVILENGIAHVDLPCSGLKSLWLGTLFLLAATWLENRRIGIRWLLVCAANFIFLILANIARVLTLVMITHVLNQPEIAEILHIPLGVFVFSTACLFTWVLLRGVPFGGRGAQEHRNRGAQGHRRVTKVRNLFLVQAVLTVCILGLSLIPHPQSTATPLALTNLEASLSVPTQSVDLTSFEQKFFADYPSTTAQKQRFDFHGVSGSLLLVSSPTWRAQHAPELCLVAMGFQVGQSKKAQLTPEITGRLLSLNQGTRKAVYWFQSSQRTTDDFISRMWGEVTRREPTWVMVSILFDQPYQLDNPEVGSFLTKVNQAVSHQFQGD